MPTPVVKLEDATFSVLDTETTGLDPRRGDRVLEVAVVSYHPTRGVLGTYTTLLDPGVDPGATHVHGIARRHMLGAPTFDMIAGDLIARLQGTVLVAHNVPFDRSFLDNELSLLGLGPLGMPTVDTLVWARRLLRLRSNRLANVCSALDVPLLDAHSALGDALATTSVLAGLLPLAAERGERLVRAPGPNDLPAATPLGTPVHMRSDGHLGRH